MNKKLWVTPELIVLTKGKPEEAVLNACKGVSYPAPCENYPNTPGHRKCLMREDAIWVGCKARTAT